MRWLQALLIALALALAGCGGSSSSSTTPSTVASVTSSTTSTLNGTTSSSRPTTTRSSKTTHSMPPTSTTEAAVSTAPPPTPAGTPAAPAGLSPTTGYSTYENCSVHCSGAAPSSLRRPLSLPAMDGHTCPTGTAAGPITPKISTHVRISSFLGSKWDGVTVTWSATSGFTGPILIRGRELDGPNAVGFGEGHKPYDELQLYAASGHAQTWPTFVRVPAPGCYGVDIDTAHKTEAFIFEATQ